MYQNLQNIFGYPPWPSILPAPGYPLGPLWWCWCAPYGGGPLCLLHGNPERPGNPPSLPITPFCASISIQLRWQMCHSQRFIIDPCCSASVHPPPLTTSTLCIWGHLVLALVMSTYWIVESVYLRTCRVKAYACGAIVCMASLAVLMLRLAFWGNTTFCSFATLKCWKNNKELHHRLGAVPTLYAL